MDMQSLRSFCRMAVTNLVFLFSLSLVWGCSSTPANDGYQADAQPQGGPEEQANTLAEQDQKAEKTETDSAAIKAQHKAIPFEQVLKEEEKKKQQTVKASKPKTSPPVKKPTTESKPKTTSNVAAETTKPIEKQVEKKVAEAATVAPKEIEEAPLKEAVAKTSKAAPQPPTFSLDQLPITIGDHWTLETDLSNCSLHSQTLSVDDGAGKTPITLILTQQHWLIKTKSDIDTSYTGTGIDLDSGQHFDLESIVKDTNVEFSKQRQALIEALPQASSATIVLGFWPTWPVTETKSITLPVANFASAFEAWKTCNQLLTAR